MNAPHAGFGPARSLTPHPRRVVGSLLASSLVLGALAARPAAGATVWPAISAAEWQEPARPDSGGSDVVILTDRAVVEDRDGEFRIEQFRRMRIITAEGRKAATVDIDYRKSFGEEIAEVSARSVRPGGAETALDPGQVIRSTVLKLGRHEYSRASFVIPGVEPGCIAEYRVVMRGKYKYGWYSPWYFVNEYYTCVSSMEWRVSEWAESKGLVPAWRVRSVVPSQVTESILPNPEHPSTIAFTSRALPGIRSEAWAPPSPEADPMVVTYYFPKGRSPLRYWEDWRREFEAWGREAGDKLGDLKGVIRDASARGASRWAALDGVCRWLQHNVRCVDELNWKERRERFRDFGPVTRDFSIPGLLHRGWGLSYQINNALAAAARSLGLEAYVVLLGDRRYAAFDYQVLGPLPNDVAVAARENGGPWRFYEPSSRFCAPGSLPWHLRGGYALLTGGTRELIVRVPDDYGDAGRSSWLLDLQLDESGSLMGQVVCMTSGESAREIKRDLWDENPDEYKAKLQSWLAVDGRPKLTFLAPDLSTDPESTLVLRGAFSLGSAASVAGNRATLSPDVVIPWRLRPGSDEPVRFQPVFYRCPRRQSIRIDFHLPGAGAVLDLPEGGRAENDLGGWDVAWSRIDDGVRFDRTVWMNRPRISRSLYASLRSLMEGLDRADHELLVVPMPQ